jgi:hypothetical protein
MYESCGVDNGDFVKCYNLGMISSKKIEKNYSILFFFILVLKSYIKNKKLKMHGMTHTFLSVSGS